MSQSTITNANVPVTPPDVQYDSIGSAYAEMKKLPAPLLEIVNVEAALKPLTKGARCLDLACGLGRYAQVMAGRFQASYVLGVDISEKMVEEARRSVSSSPEDCTKYGGGNLDFAVGDCSIPTKWSQTPFDLVLASWFFNYAPEYSTLLSMWKTASLNLRSGGRVLAIVPCNTEDPEEYIMQVNKERPRQKGMVYAELAGRVQDGVIVRVLVDLEPEPIQFLNYALKNSVYVQAAREAGFRGKIEWSDLKIPEDSPADLLEKWETYRQVPHCWLLVAEKD